MKYAALFCASIALFSLNACAQQTEKERSPAPAIARSPAALPVQQMQYVLHKASTRGETNAGWLLAKHTFSFNEYYDPDRMNFGALRVLNDDRIAGGKGFPTHGHNNMEIITIPLEGSIQHRDNMGNAGVVKTGDIQVMSAGTGITHSEANNSGTDTLRLLQIWVLPNKRNVKPRYHQIDGILNGHALNTFKTIVSPSGQGAMFIYQDAVFSMGKFDKGESAEYALSFKGNGVYAFIIEGSAVINGVAVSRRDGIGIWNTDKLAIEATSGLRVLLMEVPMLN